VLAAMQECGQNGGVGALWSYEKLFWAEVFHGVWEFCRKHLRIEVLFLLAGIIAGFFETGLSIWPLVYGLISVMVLLGFVFLFNLVVAPTRLHGEALVEIRNIEEQRNELSETLSERSQTESLVESLSRFYSLGADLIGRRITNDSELSQVKTDMQEWVDTTTMWIVQNLSKSQARLFGKASLGTRIHQFPGQYNEEHRRYQHDATQKTKYLKSLIEKYQG